jgi:tripartite-type tricarboxylate transporter receptor subunit TctC
LKINHKIEEEVFMNQRLFIGKKTVLFGLMACIFIALGTGISFAQEKYPTRNIDLIIPFNPGASTDTASRMFANELTNVLNVPIVPINKDGASGTIGTSFVAQSKKDGYTLLMGVGSPLTLAPNILPNIPYDVLRDFVPIGIVSTTPMAIYVNKDSPLKSFEDLIDMARKNPNTLSYGDPGTGTDANFFVEQLQMMAKVKFTHVPFKGGSAVMTAVMGGHVDFGVSSFAGAVNHFRAGTLRCLIIGQDKRIGGYPDIPAIAEKGYQGYFIKFWVGLLAPAGVPQNVVTTLFSAYDKITQSKTFIKKIEDTGSEVRNLGLEGFKKFIADEKKIAGDVAKQIKK